MTGWNSVCSPHEGCTKVGDVFLFRVCVPENAHAIPAYGLFYYFAYAAVNSIGLLTATS